MIIAREAKIDIVPNKNVPTVIHVSQYDDEACKIIFTLYNGGTAFAKPKGATAKVQITKPDKKAIESTCTYEEDGTVSVILTEQMTAKNGLARGKIVIMDSNGGQVGTAAFILDVDPAGIADDAIVSESDLPDLKKIMDSVGTVQQQVTLAETAATTAKKFTEAAANAEKNASAAANEASDSAQSASDSASAADKSASFASDSASAAAKSAQRAADESSTAISKLQSESKAQQDAIAKKGTDTLATIPDTYTDIADQIGNVKLSITDAGLLHIEKKEA